MRTALVLASCLLVGCTSAVGDNPGTGGGGGQGGAGGHGGGGHGGSGGQPGGNFGADMAMGNPGGQLLNFAVFGDCRPPTPDDTAGYPSTILSSVFSRAEEQNAQFVIGTGDYMFALSQATVTAQVALFEQAKAHYTRGPVYLAMGNHECTGATASNCPGLTETANVRTFVSQMLPPGVTKPYYRIDIPTPLGMAKFIFIAPNAWDSGGTQAAWLKQQLAEPTKYTFVIRHESVTSFGVPSSVPESEQIVLNSSFTLEMLGHTHEYRHVDSRHVISGNAGAPLEGSTPYGLLLIQQQPNGDLTVNEIEESSGNITDTWGVTP